jgi:phosphoribosylanthranilate isomerase
MFKIKICGITNVADVLAAADAGADAIGLNFYRASPRCVSEFAALQIVGHVSIPTLTRVGVFVNSSPSEIRRIVGQIRLTAIQLHGDEPPEMLAALQPIPTVRARRFDEAGTAAIARDLIECRAAGTALSAVLIDAMTPGRYGGTGTTVSWPGLADHTHWLDIPLILAGGLTPENVAEAIRIVRPHAVDVASGVESAPGKKDAAKIRDFVAAARAAFAAL